MKYLVALMVVALATGCVSTGNVVGNSSNSTNSTDVLVDSAAGIVMVGDHVYVDYTGKLQNGTVFDSSIGRAPLDFNVGEGSMIKGFDTAVMGMRIGQEKTITIEPDEGYGQWSSTNVIDVNASIVPNGTYVGQTLYSGSGQQAVVLSINSTSVTLDLNHPLAGKTLIFDIKLVDIVKA